MKALCFLMVTLMGMLLACTTTAVSTPAVTVRPAAIPSPTFVLAVPVTTEPQGSLFYELPQRKVGETAEGAGFKITLRDARIANGKLLLNIELGNTTPYQVDLNEALQLRDDKGHLLPPDADATLKTLETSSQVQGQWQYSLNTNTASMSTWRLIYAPRGWSGPVFVYRIQ